jgi:hypothetical protein
MCKFALLRVFEVLLELWRSFEELWGALRFWRPF